MYSRTPLWSQLELSAAGLLKLGTLVWIHWNYLVQAGVVDFSLGLLCWASSPVTPNLPNTLVVF